VCSAITKVSKSELKRKILSKSETISISKRKKQMKSKKKSWSKCPPNWSRLHPNDQNRLKKAIIGQKWSKSFQLDVPNIFGMVPNGQEQDFNKIHIEK